MSITLHMPRAFYRRFFLFPCLIGVLTVVFSHPVPQSLGKKLSDGIAAIVNSEVITLSELEEELKDEKIRLRARFQGEELERRLLQREYEALNNLIEQKLQLQEAKAKGLRVTEDELQEVLDRLSPRTAISDTSSQDSKEQIREELVLRKLLDVEVRRHVMVSPKEIRNHYTNFPNRFLAPSEHRLRQIFLLANPEENKDALQARARSIYDDLKKGASFSEMAQQYSDGPEGVRGGDLGYLKKSELLAPLAQKVDSLQPGEISHPIETTLGMHIMMVEDVKSQKALPFEEVKDQIRNFLLQQKTKEVYQVWLSDLKDKAYIEVKF